MSQEEKAKATGYILMGFGIALLVFAGIGLLDQHHMLDPILDYLNVP